MVGNTINFQWHSKASGNEFNWFLHGLAGNAINFQWIFKVPGKDFNRFPKYFTRIWQGIRLIAKGADKEIDYFFKDFGKELNCCTCFTKLFWSIWWGMQFISIKLNRISKVFGKEFYWFPKNFLGIWQGIQLIAKGADKEINSFSKALERNPIAFSMVW